MKAVVLAGGLGTRLRDAVPDLPKPMAPVAGRPFLACVLDALVRVRIEKHEVNVGNLQAVPVRTLRSPGRARR